MSRASKISAARGQTHNARHATNVAREKLNRIAAERDKLLEEVARLTKYSTNQADEVKAGVALAEKLRKKLSTLTEVLEVARATITDNHNFHRRVAWENGYGTSSLFEMNMTALAEIYSAQKGEKP